MAQTNKEFLQQLMAGQQPGGPQPGSPVALDPNREFLQRMLGGGAYTTPGPREATDMADIVTAGLQGSATGLAWRGENPNLTLRSDATWGQRAAANAAGMLVDLPLSIVGAIAGSVGGTAVAGPPGTVAGGMAGAFAAPMALREALTTAYSQNHARDWSDVWEITKSALSGGGKGAALGLLTGGAGKFGTLALPATAGTTAKLLASTAAELPVLTTAAAALEGHMPTAQDFMDNAILLGGFKGAVHIAPKLRAVFAETGRLPSEVQAEALKNPELKAELTARPGTQPYEALLDAYIEKLPEANRGVRYEGQVFPAIGKETHIEPMMRMIAARGGKENVDASKIETGVITPGGRFLTHGEHDSGVYGAFRDNTGGISRRLAEKSFEQARAIPPFYAEQALQERVKAAINTDPRNNILGKALVELSRGDEKVNLEALFKELPDVVKMEYITDNATARGVLRSIEQMYHDEITVGTRGVVPITATMEAGMRRLAQGIDPHIIGEGEAPSMIAARATLLGAATEHIKRVTQELAQKPEADWTTTDKLRLAASLESVQMAYVDVRGASAEVGRALNVLRQIKYNKNLMGEADAIINLFSKNFKGGTWHDIATMAAALKNPAQLAMFAKEIHKATNIEKGLEIWKSAILSGPQTHMANMMGNLLKLAVEIPETALTATMTVVRTALSGKKNVTFAEYKAKAFAPLHGLLWGWRDAGAIAVEAFRGEGAHLEKADIFRHAIEGKFGRFVRIPFRLLQAEDVLFRTIAERGRGYELAVERAIREGFKPETREYNDRVAEYTMRPDFGLEAADAVKIMDDVKNAGAEAVFAQRLGPRMEQVQAAMAGHPIQFVIPFVRTPVNLLSWAVQHTPVMNLLSQRWINDFKAGGALRDRAIARVAVGTAMSITAFVMAADGNITGGGMFDQERRTAKMAAGWQPYSIKLDDKYYSYQRLEPVAKVLGFAADFFEMREKLDAEDQTKGWMAVVAMFGNATISTTYLSGLAGTFQALTDPTRYGENFVEQYASSLVPKIIGQTAMLIDPHKREIDTVTDAIQSQIPYLREKLMPKRDVWGDPRKNEKLFGVLPVATSEASKNKVKTEAMRLGLSLVDVGKFVHEAGPLKSGERKIELRPETRDIMKEISGKAAMSILAPIVASPDWEKIPEFAQGEVIRRVLQAARTQARYAALPADSKERVEMRQKITDEIVKQVQQVGG